MTVQPQRLDEASFFEFVAQSTPSVVFVSVHRIHAFSTSLPQRVLEAGIERATFGTYALPDLVLAQRALQFMIHASARSGLPHAGVVAGYHLFIESELIAYDAGLPLRSDADQLLRGAALGAVQYRATGRASSLWNALVGAANTAASRRVALNFAHAFAAHRSRPRGTSGASPRSTHSELHWAYSTLGVAPNATDAEVNRAWRRLRLAHHPDHAASDPAEFARRTLRSRELNQARDVIFAHRSQQRTAA